MERLDISLLKQEGSIKKEGYFPIQLDCGELQLPVFIFQGKKSPRLTAVGAQHACETCGTDGMIRLMEELRGADPGACAGSLVLIPVANIPGYPLRAHNTSQYDGTNLNRSYPGSPSGNTSERIADMIWRIASTGDYVLDLHGGDMNEDVIRYAEMHLSEEAALMEKSLGMAACFDLNTALVSISGRDYAYPDFRSLYGLAQENGIAASIVEAGGSGISDEDSIVFFHEGLKKVMIHLGMWKGEQRDKKKMWVTRWVSCIERPASGIFTSFVNAGDPVFRGQEIGKITDYFGHRLDTIRSPREGVVSLVQSCRGKSEDDLIYMIIDKEDGEFVEV